LNTLTELEVKAIFSAMNAVTFDTHQFIQTLKAAGFDEKQAEAVTHAFKKAQQQSELASKQDLREMEYRLTIKVGAMLGATIAIITTLDKLL
jgi:hypothetical protein